jgi:hypothetical protein
MALLPSIFCLYMTVKLNGPQTSAKSWTKKLNNFSVLTLNFYAQNEGEKVEHGDTPFSSNSFR